MNGDENAYRKLVQFMLLVISAALLRCWASKDEFKDKMLNYFEESANQAVPDAVKKQAAPLYDSLQRVQSAVDSLRAKADSLTKHPKT